jgi:hypothetical protein
MPIQGKPGRLIELRKTDINIPHEYQRDLLKSRATKIAREFDWFQFGVLIIAHRNGEYFVVDGEHRLTAALSLEELDLLPCMLYDFEGPLHEAEIFIKLQVNRKSLVTRDLHKAELFVGGEFGAVAQKSQEFIESLDCEAYPLSTIRLLRRQKSRAFARIAPLIPELVGTATLRKDFIEAIVYLEDVLGPHESLATVHRKQLFDKGYEPLVDLMIAYETQHRKGVAKIASPRMKAEALRWALFTAGHRPEAVTQAGPLPGAGDGRRIKVVNEKASVSRH